jgi:hypothetical protein
MPYVPNYTVIRRIEYVMKSYGNLYGSHARSEVAGIVR